MTHDYDYIIVGQGICGTFLSHFLIKENCSVFVIDEYKPNAASRVARGVINPVTGRRIVKTWKIDELMPFARKAYNEIGEKSGVENIIQQTTILDIHATSQMQQAFEKRLSDNEHHYIRACENENDWKKYFHFDFGIGEISPAYIIDLQKLLIEWRNFLLTSNSISDEYFDENSLQLNSDFVLYKNIKAKKIIFCDGINSIQNKYFNHLPFALNKGEALIVSIPDLPQNFLYKQGFSIVPSGDNLFWIGSSYEWNFENNLPTNVFKERVENHLKENLKIPFEIKNHVAALRPANTERRPFVGLSEMYPQVGILNGMGTKGCSLAPYYANQLTKHLLFGNPIDEEADVQRFL